MRYTLAAAHEASLDEVLEQLGSLGGGLVPAEGVVGSLLADAEEVSQPYRRLGLLSADENVGRFSCRGLADRLRERPVTRETTVRDGLRLWPNPLRELLLAWVPTPRPAAFRC